MNKEYFVKQLLMIENDIQYYNRIKTTIEDRERYYLIMKEIKLENQVINMCDEPQYYLNYDKSDYYYNLIKDEVVDINNGNLNDELNFILEEYLEKKMNFILKNRLLLKTKIKMLKYSTE